MVARHGQGEPQRQRSDDIHFGEHFADRYLVSGL